MCLKAFITAAFEGSEALYLYRLMGVSAPSLHRESTDSLMIRLMAVSARSLHRAPTTRVLYKCKNIFIQNVEGCRDGSAKKYRNKEASMQQSRE